MVLEKKDGDERERRFLFLCQKLSRSVEKGGVNFLFSSFSLFFFFLSLSSLFLFKAATTNKRANYTKRWRAGAVGGRKYTVGWFV